MKLAQAKAIAVTVTHVYEGGGVTWDFDGAGLSLGLLQWNIKMGTLQPMLKKYLATEDSNVRVPSAAHKSLWHMLTTERPAQMAWTRAINDYTNKRLLPSWEEVFRTIVTSPVWKELEVAASEPYFKIATDDTKWSGVPTVRAYCMFFDLAVQNGGMGSALKLALSAAKPFLKAASKDGKTKNTENDKAWLIACAGSRALMAYMSTPAFAMNVFKRKLGIVEGGYNWRKGELPQVRAEVNFEASAYGVSDETIEDL